VTVSASGRVDCSVVVPVFNRGEALEAGAESLRAQTFPADRFEVVYVDDGSNDGRTPELIDRTVAAMPNARGFHEPPSGSPGRPRNIGLAHATGEYVFFADHDDWFDPEALERLVGFARENDSDVVLGKVVAHGRRTAIPRIFRESRANIPAAEAMISLTPHKLFRRAFLVEHDIRYPEGKIRLEDHHFVTHAYLHARTISVYADHVCYHHNAPGDDGNFSRSATDPDVYTAGNREVIELILRHTAHDPERRIALLQRPVQHELIKKAGPRRLGQLSAEGETRKHHALRAALAAVDAYEVIDQLGAFPRATARALRNDDPDAVRRIDDLERRLALAAEVTSLRADSKALAIGYRVTLEHDGWPVLFHPSVGTGMWRLSDGVLKETDADCDEREADLLSVDLELLISDRRSSVQWHLVNSAEAALETSGSRLSLQRARTRQLIIRGAAELSVAGLAGSRLTPGVWDVKLRADILGVGLTARLAASQGGHPPGLLPSLTLPRSNLRASVVVTPRRTLALDVKRLRPSRPS
jgi:glycosyltransferase involved in cell wall biosynthesis